MDTYYEYEALFLKHNPISVRRLVRHNSMGRVHWHEALEILYFTHGKAITACNLEEYKVHKGSIVLVNGNELHTGIISQFDSVFYCIQFSPSFFHNLIGDKYVVFENIIEDEDCTKLLDSLIAASEKSNDYKRIVETKKLAYDLFILLTERYVKNVSGEEEYKKQFKKLDTFHHIIDYLDTHYHEDIIIADLSAHFNMSASYFAHFFKQYAQKSVIEYVNETRIVHAKGLLEKEETPISDIALRVGFSDINYFSRKFKAITGVTPTQYKKSYGKPQ